MIEDFSYNEKFQEFLICFFLSSSDSFARCQSILSPSYFSGTYKKIMKYILDYSNEYNTTPRFEDINARFGKDLKPLEGIKEQDEEAFLSIIEKFCRHKAIENLILASPDYLEKKNYGELERRLKEALLISLHNDLGLNYFENPKERLQKLLDRNSTVSTGWKEVDYKLFGGLNRGEITIFAGNSGVGKSLFLQNISLNWLQMKMNVVYITCELSELLVALRIDAMLTGTNTKEVFRKMDDVELQIKLAAKDYGKLQIKYLPPGTTSNGIKSYLKEYEIKTGIKPDALVVDYLDLLYPNSNRVNPSDLFIKDKFVTEELRALAVEKNLLCVSASQLNRTAINEMDHDQSMIAGGISKINTSDNVISIYASDTMKRMGEYRLKFIKTRSSSGVGSSVNLKFDINTLRITDKDNADENIQQEKREEKRRGRKKREETITDENIKQPSTRSDDDDLVNNDYDFSENRIEREDKERDNEDQMSKLKSILSQIKRK